MTRIAFKRYLPEISMGLIILIWGFHFIVIKDAISGFDSRTYNSIRFAVGAPILSLLGLRYWRRLAWRDGVRLLLLSLMGQTGYQVLFMQGLSLTTSTNTALLTATLPVWTAVLSIVLGLVRIHRLMILGVIITFGGVALVVLGQSGSRLSLSHDDLIGSGLVLLGTLLSAVFNLYSKPIVDRYGGMAVALWTYWITVVSLAVYALPQLVALSADDLPLRIWPNLFYSGVLAGVGGYVVWNYALRELGPSRAVNYYNFTPLVAAFAGVIVLGEPITAGLMLGGTLTLLGVVIVRRNLYLRPPRSDSP